MKIKSFFNIIYWTILTAIFLVAAAVFLSAFNTPLKFRLFNVQSGSMVPTIPVGSVVFVQPQDSYSDQDIITFRSERSKKETVTHRIIETIEDQDIGRKAYKTKGDANEDSDRELIESRRVIGKVLFHIPYLGYPVAFAQSQLGLLLIIVIPATIIIYSEIMNIKKESIRIYKARKAKKLKQSSPESSLRGGAADEAISKTNKKPTTKSTTKPKSKETAATTKSASQKQSPKKKTTIKKPKKTTS